MISDTLPLGPRRTAVAKAEIEVTVAESLVDMAIDAQDWPLVTTQWARVLVARAKVQDLLTMWIMNVPGAAEFFDTKESAGGAR